MGEEAEILLKCIHVFIIFQADFKWECMHEVRVLELTFCGKYHWIQDFWADFPSPKAPESKYN